MTTEDNRQLEIVNEADEVVGLALRSEIHRKGRLHREVHIIFYTPNGEIILQHRHKNKDTQPDKLDATVGGHVEIGQDYLEAALMEMREETGVETDSQNLIFLKKIRIRSEDKEKMAINDVFRSVYAFPYNGEISKLKIEEGKSQGFVIWPLAKMTKLTDEEKGGFVNSIVSPEYDEVYEKLADLQNK